MVKRRARWFLWVPLVFGCYNPPAPIVQHTDAAASQPARVAPARDLPASRRTLPPDAASTGTVARVIDGDTLRLGNGDKVRLIGVDTPETVHPNKPVECFGKEAAEFTRKFISGEEVTLEYEYSSGVSGNLRDKYGRLLAYVYRKRDNADLNAELVRQGYAHAYVSYPFSRMEEFRRYEREAREAGRGLWGPGLSLPPAEKPEPLSETTSTPSTPQADSVEATVYVTRTGTHYHRGICSSAGKTGIPMDLRQAKARYSPCSVCKPPR